MSENKVVREFTAERETILPLEPVDPDGLFGSINVTVERGILKTTKTDGTVSEVNRFRVLWTKPKAEDPSVGMAGKIDAAIAACLKNAGYGTVDDFTYDVTSEFFQAQAKVNSSDEDPFARDDADELLSARKQMDELANAALNDETNAQATWRDVSKLAQSVFLKLNSNGKAFKRWAEGAAHAGEAPWLAQLAKGKNALSELRIMAQLSDVEFSVLPLAYTRGGAIDLFIRDAVRGDAIGHVVAAIVDDGSKLPTIGDSDKHTLSSDQLDLAIKAFIDGTLGVKAPYGSVDEGLELAKDALTAQVQEYQRIYGKDWSHVEDRKQADAAARYIMGKVRLYNLATAAWELETAIDDALSAGNKDKAEKLTKERDAAGTFVAHVVHCVVKHNTEVHNNKAKRSREASARTAVLNAEPVSGAKKMAEEPALDVAARLFKTMTAHRQPDAVMERLKEMWAIYKEDHQEPAQAAE